MLTAIIMLVITLMVVSAVYMISLSKLTDRIQRDEERYQLGVQMAAERARNDFGQQLKIVREEFDAERVKAETAGFQKGKQFAFDWLQSRVEAGEMEVKLLPKQ